MVFSFAFNVKNTLIVYIQKKRKQSSKTEEPEILRFSILYFEFRETSLYVWSFDLKVKSTN